MIDHFSRMAPFYERVVGPPDATAWRRPLRLPTDGWLLDVGGGTGRVGAALRPWVGRVVVCDVAAGMVAQAQGKRGVAAVRAPAERLPFRSGSFARVIVVDALHHFDDQTQALREAARVLAPGGRLVIHEPDVRRWPIKAAALLERVALMQSRFLAPGDVRVALAATGLDARVETDGFTAWIIADKALGSR